jgi:hypothetical protein
MGGHTLASQKVAGTEECFSENGTEDLYTADSTGYGTDDFKPARLPACSEIRTDPLIKNTSLD